jgi:hypothetical protein
MSDFTSAKPIAVSLNSNILWLVFGVAVLVFATMSLVYVYHWRTYGTGNRTIRIVERLYVLVGILLIALTALLITIR